MLGEAEHYLIFMSIQSLPKSIGAVGFEDGLVLLLARPNNRAKDWKLQLVAAVQVGLWSPDLVLFVQNGSPDDGDGVRGGSVVPAHFLVELAHSPVERHITILLVHVVVAGTRFVAEHDTEGFYMVGAPLENFVDRQDLALR